MRYGNDVSKSLAPLGWGHVPHSTTPSPGKWFSGAYFLPYWPWIVPYWLRFKENTAVGIHWLINFNGFLPCQRGTKCRLWVWKIHCTRLQHLLPRNKLQTVWIRSFLNLNEHCPHTSYINNNIFINLILTKKTWVLYRKKYFWSYNCTKKVGNVRYSVFSLKLKKKLLWQLNIQKSVI